MSDWTHGFLVGAVIALTLPTLVKAVLYIAIWLVLWAKGELTDFV